MRKELIDTNELFIVKNGEKIIINDDNKEFYGIIGDISRIRGNISYIKGDVSNIYGNVTGIVGDISGVKGCVTGIRGGVSGIKGNITRIYGDVSGIKGNITGVEGNFDDCGLTNKDRENGINIKDLIK